MNNNISIITDPDGKKLVLINDVKFKSRRTLNWTTVEEVLKEYIGKYFEIQETAERVYIGPDFPASVRMLVRCDKDGKLYLYDFVRTKKETSKPLE